MAIPPVDSFNIPKKMSPHQLEWWILFGICVANKPAAITETKLKSFFNIWARHVNDSPFSVVRFLIHKGVLEHAIKMAKFGQYGRITEAFKQVVNIDLYALSVESLEAVHGIGPKTARMIILYSDPTAECVPLDTHVLKFLRKKGYDAPKNTPSAGKKYNQLEAAFVAEAKKAGKTVRELDTEVWLSYAKQ